MTTVGFVSGAILGLLLAEWRLSRRHEAALRARGAVVPSGDVYAAMAVAYPAAFLAMIVEGVWRASLAAPAAGAVAPGLSPSWFASGALLFVAAKALKYWAIAALGDRWTFRVIIEPDRPLVTHGPYRYVAHPNYVAVVAELVAAALMLHAAVTGPAALLVFAPLLWARIRFESRTLRDVIR